MTVTPARRPAPPLTATADEMRRLHVDEVQNLTFPYRPAVDREQLSRYRTEGAWWELLAELDLTLALSREYEHLLYLLHASGGQPAMSLLELPHPSGIAVDADRRRLIVSSTRTPNQLIEFRLLDPARVDSEIVPDDVERPEGSLFVPVLKQFLPGSLYTHDVALVGGDLVLTATGHNFLARVAPEGGWERIWWPALLDRLERDRFNENYLQLNSIAAGPTVAESFFTAFSDQTGGAKPWKAGYGPRGKGVLFEGASREVVLRDLTCPHSARFYGGRLWLCNSGYGEVGTVEREADGRYRYEPVIRVEGFTRGLCFAGRYAFVGLSRVIPKYEAYAPGLSPEESRCAIVAFDIESGERVATLDWPSGYQIYDLQPMVGLDRPMLPAFDREGEHFNPHLRYRGWSLGGSRDGATS